MEKDERMTILDDIAPYAGRCTKESTHLIDSYIQELYNRKENDTFRK